LNGEKRDAAILRARDLSIRFATPYGLLKAVDGIGFDILRDETLGVVGESGCGKSVTALSMLRLLPHPAARVDGSILFEGTDLLALSERDIRRIRGARIAMIFQEPMTSLNPVLTVGFQLKEAILLHQKCPEREAAERSVESLRMVQIPDPQQCALQYPFELSGGMRQRVMIAMAVSCHPQLLIADEPTTALDVTIQAQILDLIRELKTRIGTTVVLISHNLGVIAETVDRVIVMYAGSIVEEAPVGEIFSAPRHPYTAALLQSTPRLGRNRRGRDGSRLMEIPGLVPSLHDHPEGCPFEPRCPLAVARCRTSKPPLVTTAPAHRAACWESSRVAGMARA
jgi:oligopeptide/dipeptide ABC transporter ATP-binding protein